MRSKISSRVLALVLCVMMLVGAMSLPAFAEYNKDYVSPTHTVFRHTEQTLAPGVTQYTNYAYTTADQKQMVYYTTIADVTRSDVVVQISYKDMQYSTFGMQKLSDMVAVANDKYSDPGDPEFINEYYTVVSATNGNGYNMTTGQPSGCWAMGGTVIQEYTGSTAFFAILKDGRAVMGKTVAEWNAYKADPGIQEAINAFGSILVWDGAATVSATGSYYTDRHSRTMLGVTAEGKVILIVVDGRQEPFSCGASMAELAQIMLEAGAEYAINLDGGGSTTYMAKNEGTDECVVTNRPSDGSERAISNGLIVASLAPPSDTFDHASLTPVNDYITVNASTQINATGVSPAGTSAEIPAEAYYTTDNGTISADGVLTPAALGDATVQLVYDGNVVGETVVHVVVPDEFAFSVSTLAAPYGQVADITMVATYGEFDYEVKYAPADFSFTVANPSFGYVDGFQFHATDDTTVTGATEITAALAGSSDTVTIPLTVGKGSEVLFDFEDPVDNHQTSRWSGFDGYNAGIVTTCTPVTAANGKVHSGEYAMAYDMDFTQLTYYEDYTYSLMCYNWDDIAAHGFTYDADGVQQRGAEEDFVDITGATGLGMWMYIPDEIDVRGLDVRYTIGGKKTATSPYERVNSAMGVFFPYRDGLGSDGWYYYYFDLSAYSSWACLRLQNCRKSNNISKNGRTAELYGDVMQLYINDRAWKDNDKQFKSYSSHVTLYIDDITVDYSSVVPDREAPVFGAINYAYTGASDAPVLNNNATIAYSDLEFMATVAENTTKTNATGLDTASLKALVDGNEVASSYNNGRISVDEIPFADGVHTITFEATDHAGNTSHVTRTFTVNAGSAANTIRVVARDPSITSTYVGSLYYIDLIATDISAVDSVTTTLKVNNVNDWEPEGIEAADGFTATYEPSNFDKGLITLTVEKTGDVAATGEAVIASIPVRTWYPHNALGKDSSWIILTKKCVYPMDTQVFTKAGLVEFADGTSATFSAPAIQCDSEAMCEYGYIGVNKGNEDGTIDVTSWHEHTAEPLPDVAATCTEDGYTGRTFCAVCNSVIDWGTTEPATGHNYDFVEGTLQCTGCGDLFNGEYTDGKLYEDGLPVEGWIEDSYYVDGEPLTGIAEADGYYYDFGDDGVCPDRFKYSGLLVIDGANHCVKNGSLVNGWQSIDDEWYFFDLTTGAGLNGTWNLRAFGYVEPGTFTFVDGKLQNGVWFNYDNNKTKYCYGPGTYFRTWKTIDGGEYYFDIDGYALKGYHRLLDNPKSITSPNRWYHFDETTGLLLERLTDTGIVDIEGTLYYMEEGVSTYAGLIQIGDDYYYVKSDGSLVVDKLYRITKNNDLLPIDDYLFGADGKILNVPEAVDPNKNGLIEEDGVLRYYVDGALTYAGLIEIDGDYYYINSHCEAVTSKLYRITKNNDLLPIDDYLFDADGKILNVPAPVEPHDPKNGLIWEDGVLHYYVDDVLTYAGLIEIDGDYYYINSHCEAITGKLYRITKNNDLLPIDDYLFDADGKIVNVPAE